MPPKRPLKASKASSGKSSKKSKKSIPFTPRWYDKDGFPHTSPPPTPPPVIVISDSDPEDETISGALSGIDRDGWLRFINADGEEEAMMFGPQEGPQEPSLVSNLGVDLLSESGNVVVDDDVRFVPALSQPSSLDTNQLRQDHTAGDWAGRQDGGQKLDKFCKDPFLEFDEKSRTRSIPQLGDTLGPIKIFPELEQPLESNSQSAEEEDNLLTERPVACTSSRSWFSKYLEEDEEENNETVPSKGLSFPIAEMTLSPGGPSVTTAALSSSVETSTRIRILPASLPLTATAQASSPIIVPNLKKDKKKENQSALMEFLEDKPFDNDRDELERLGKAAGLRRDLSEKSILFRDDKGFGFWRTDQPGTFRPVVEDLRLKFKQTVSDVKKTADARNNATLKHKESRRKADSNLIANRTTHYIRYFSTVFTTDLDVLPCREGRLPWYTVLSSPISTRTIYPGYWSSHYGLICMRWTHFNNVNDSKIKDTMISLGPDAICLELSALVCEDKGVAQQSEAFVMYYLDKWNSTYPDDQQTWIDNQEPTASLVKELGLHAKAERYVRDGIRLYQIVPDDHSELLPPYPHLATLEEATSLPIFIPQSAIKERWLDGTRVDEERKVVKNYWGEVFGQIIGSDEDL